MSHGEVIQLFERYKQHLILNSQDDRDLLDEIFVKLRKLTNRHQKIERLNEEIALKLNSNTFGNPSEIRKLALSIARKHFPSGVEPQIRSWSFAHGTNMNQATEEESDLYEMIKINYDDMFRIMEICRERKELRLKFKAKGVSTTENQLIKHAGTKNKATVTQDSLVISSEGPIIKGSRRSDQSFILEGECKSGGIQFGKYFKEYREFMDNLSNKLKLNLQVYSKVL